MCTRRREEGKMDYLDVIGTRQELFSLMQMERIQQLEGQIAYLESVVKKMLALSKACTKVNIDFINNVEVGVVTIGKGSDENRNDYSHTCKEIHQSLENIEREFDRYLNGPKTV